MTKKTAILWEKLLVLTLLVPTLLLVALHLYSQQQTLSCSVFLIFPFLETLPILQPKIAIRTQNFIYINDILYILYIEFCDLLFTLPDLYNIFLLQKKRITRNIIFILAERKKKCPKKWVSLGFLDHFKKLYYPHI